MPSPFRMQANQATTRYNIQCCTAALNWYRANVQLEQFGDTKPRPAPLLRCPVLGVWSTRDAGVLEEQMTASARYVMHMRLICRLLTLEIACDLCILDIASAVEDVWLCNANAIASALVPAVQYRA